MGAWSETQTLRQIMAQLQIEDWSHNKSVAIFDGSLIHRYIISKMVIMYTTRSISLFISTLLLLTHELRSTVYSYTFCTVCE